MHPLQYSNKAAVVEEEDYMDVCTHAINTRLLCEDKIAADLEKYKAWKEQQDDLVRNNMHQGLNNNQLKILFRRDVHKIAQFEKDEKLFNKQFNSNVGIMFSRFKYTDITKSPEDI